MVRAVATAGQHSATSEPVLDVRDEGIEVAEARETFYQAPEVDRGVVVDEDVPKARETREPGRGGGGEHAMGGEPRGNLRVLVRGVRDVAGQNVIAGIEQRLGGHLYPALDRPLEESVLL